MKEERKRHQEEGEEVVHQVHQEEQGEIMVHAKDNGENESKVESKEGEG